MESKPGNSCKIIEKRMDNLLLEDNSNCQVLISCDFYANYAVPIELLFRQMAIEKWVFMKEDPHPTESDAPQSFSSKFVIESSRTAAGFYSCIFKNSNISRNSNLNSKSTILKIEILCKLYFFTVV